jgi:CO/xanthine dehydrogenase FAD-binding subunit
MREVFLPRNLDDLWELLEKEPRAAIFAGGTDLLVKMKSGEFHPPCLVCLERIAALQGVKDDGREVFIGSATTHSRLLENPIVQEHFPVLAKSESLLASPPIRHMGTIGGNIVTASPAGDTLPALYVLGAEVEIGSGRGSRRLPLESFIRGPGNVDLQQGEVLIGVWLQKAQHWNIHHYEKIGRRKAQACAIASMAAIIQISSEGRVEKARLAWGSVGPTVVSSAAADECITGRDLSLETLRPAAKIIQDAVSPIDDIRASAEYRRIVAGALLLRLAEYAAPTSLQSNDSQSSTDLTKPRSVAPKT